MAVCLNILKQSRQQGANKMNYNIATLFAATGHTLMLPGWQGYFKFDWNKKELYFQNGDCFFRVKHKKEN